MLFVIFCKDLVTDMGPIEDTNFNLNDFEEILKNEGGGNFLLICFSLNRNYNRTWTDYRIVVFSLFVKIGLFLWAEISRIFGNALIELLISQSNEL